VVGRGDGVGSQKCRPRWRQFVLKEWQIFDYLTYQKAVSASIAEAQSNDWLHVVCLDGTSLFEQVSGVLSRSFPHVPFSTNNCIQIKELSLAIDFDDERVFTDMSAIAITGSEFLPEIGLCYFAYDEFMRNDPLWPLNHESFLRWARSNSVYQVVVRGQYLRRAVLHADQTSAPTPGDG